MSYRLPGLVLACTLAALSPTASAQTLVALWRFDNTGSSQPDSTTNGNTATASGNASWVNDTTNLGSTPFDGSNGVFSFDGSGDFLTVAHSASVGQAGDITLAAWIKAAAPGADGQNILSKTSGFAGSYVLWFNTSSRPQVIRGDATSTNGTFTDPDTSYTTNTWQHWAMTMSGDSVTFYLNGNSVHTGTLSFGGPYADGGTSLLIGMRTGLAGTYNGSLDDVAVFSGALNQSAVQTIMTGDFSAYAIPEPGTYALFGGLAALAATAYWRRRRPN